MRLKRIQGCEFEKMSVNECKNLVLASASQSRALLLANVGLEVNIIPAHLDEEKCFRRTGPRTDEIKPGVELATFAVERQQSRGI